MASDFSVKESKKGLTFDIQVTPRASRAGISGICDNALKIKVTALPQEGAANEACIRLLAKELRLRKSQLTVLAGQKSRWKTILVADLAKEELAAKLKIAVKQE